MLLLIWIAAVQPQAVQFYANPWDPARWIGGVASLVVAGTAIPTMLHPMRWHQRARIGGSAMLAVAIIASNISTMGTQPMAGWRTFLATVGVSLFAAGMVALVREQRREPLPDSARVRHVDRLSSVPAAVVYADSTSRIISVAGSCETLLDYTSAQLIGRPLATIIPEGNRDRHFEGLKRLVETGEERVSWRRLDLNALKRDGTVAPVHLVVIPLEGQRFLGVLRARVT